MVTIWLPIICVTIFNFIIPTDFTIFHWRRKKKIKKRIFHSFNKERQQLWDKEIIGRQVSINGWNMEVLMYRYMILIIHNCNIFFISLTFSKNYLPWFQVTLLPYLLIVMTYETTTDKNHILIWKTM